MGLSKSTVRIDKAKDFKVYKLKGASSALYYNQSSNKVPPYYSRPGPGAYNLD